MIQLENVSVRYGDTVALHPVSLTIPDGQFTVLLERSGAGKSAFLRCFNLMSCLDSGELRVSGFAGNWNSKNLQRLRRQTGMIFQQHQLIGRRTALQNVLMGRLGYHSVFRSIFPLSVQEQELGLRSLRRVGLLDKALCRVDELSGGQQQRVGIARVLTQQPRTILADEPVASLDPATAEKVMDLIREIENYYLELVGAAFAEIGVGNRANRLAFFERVNRVIEDNHHVAVAVTKCMPYDFQNDIQAKFARVNVKGIAKCFFGDFPSKEEKNLLELVSLGIASLYCATIVGKSGLSTKEVAEASVKLLDCIDPHLKGES